MGESSSSSSSSQLLLLLLPPRASTDVGLAYGARAVSRQPSVHAFLVKPMGARERAQHVAVDVILQTDAADGALDPLSPHATRPRSICVGLERNLPWRIMEGYFVTWEGVISGHALRVISKNGGNFLLVIKMGEEEKEKGGGRRGGEDVWWRRKLFNQRRESSSSPICGALAPHTQPLPPTPPHSRAAAHRSALRSRPVRPTLSSPQVRGFPHRTCLPDPHIPIKNARARTHTHTHPRARARTHTHTHTPIGHVCWIRTFQLRTRAHARAHTTRTHADSIKNARARAHTHTHTHARARTHTHTHTHTQTHSHTHTSSPTTLIP